MNPAERQTLVDALLEGEISEADFLRLEAELSVDPDARREYYDQIKLSLLLENVASESGPIELSAEKAPEADVRLAEGPPIDKRWKWAFSLMALVAAGLLVVIGLQFKTPADLAFESGERPVDPINEKVENAGAGFAVVSGQAEATWDGDLSLASGSVVPPGELHLLSGVVQLELFSGVSLVVEGDASFSVISPMEVAVSRGKVRARVPEPAQGFRLRTAEGEVVDLGTEFAVNVTDESSEVHVLDGEVEWHPLGSTSRRMEQGESVRRSRDGKSLDTVEQSFVGTDELQDRLKASQNARLQRWKQDSEETRHDPRLLACYQIAHSDPSGRRLPNLAVSNERTSSEGAVVAATLARGRWGEPNGALDFSPAGSRVRVNVHGEYRGLTLMCWVKINSVDRWYNSLFLTDGHELQEPHWQIMNDGRLFFSVKKFDKPSNKANEQNNRIFYSPPFWDSSLSGKWIMLATVYDVDAKRVTHFLDGESISSEVVPDEDLVESVKIGPASIANWSEPMYRTDPDFVVRNLNGSIDEFALFAGALSAAEIAELFRIGNPNE